MQACATQHAFKTRVNFPAGNTEEKLSISDRSMTFTSRKTSHFEILDGLRGIAVLLVIHFHWFIFAAHPPTKWEFLLGLGWLGVDLFFVISGFLITGLLLQSRREPSYFRNFYARRALKIFPLYYGLLFVAMLLKPTFPVLSYEAGRETWYLFFLYNFPVAFGSEYPQGTLCPVWSLAVEVQFYLLWPFIIRYCDAKKLIQISFGLLALAITTRWAAVIFQRPLLIYYSSFVRLDGILLGSLVAIALKQLDCYPLRRLAKPLAITCAVAFFALAYMDKSGRWSTRGMLILGMLFSVTFFAASLFLLLTAPKAGLVQTLIKIRPLRSIGRYSYGVYLFQMTVLASCQYLFPPFNAFIEASWLNNLLGFAGFVAVTYSAAFISFHLYEKHFLNLKRYFSSDRAQPAQDLLSVSRI